MTNKGIAYIEPRQIIPIKKNETIKVRIGKLLRGGKNGIRAYKYSEITNDFLRPSTLVSEGPHIKLLKQYIEDKDDIFQPDIFVETPYYKNAQKAISLCGSYFYNETSKIFSNPKHNYTKTLLAAIPQPNPQGRAERIKKRKELT